MASLGAACAAGDVRSIRYLLDNGASVNDEIVSGHETTSRLVNGCDGACTRGGWMEPLWDDVLASRRGHGFCE
jgi:hypothetical protein